MQISKKINFIHFSLIETQKIILDPYIFLRKYSVKGSLFKNRNKFHSVSYIKELQALSKSNHCRTETYDVAPHDGLGVVRKRTTWHSMC